MLRTSRVLLLPSFVLSFLMVLIMAGCGGGASIAHPAPAGFTNASLNGTFAFSISGSNANGFFAVAGSFQANGNGTITGGTEDFTSPSAVFTNQALTGAYAVRSDGRTSATLTSTNVTLNLDFVLLNTSSGLAIRFQNTGTGSGSIDLQNSAAFNQPALAGPFAFSLSGVDLANPPNPQGTAGLLNIDSAGDIVGGSVLDNNDSGAVTLNAAIPITGLALSAPAGVNGRGTIAFQSPVTGATVHFAYYVVDANHLKIVETDTGAIGTSFLAGDAFRQTSSTVSGNFAFTLAGATNAGTGIFVAGGILNTDGAGNILNTSVTDVNNGGTFFPAVATTGTYSISGGRGTMAFSGSFGTLNLVIYPSSGGLLMLEVNTTVLSSGTGLQQSGAPFSNGAINGGFGLNLTGANANGEVDGIGQFNSTGTGTLSGAFDFNNFGLGALSNSVTLNGTYSISANGRGTGTLNPSTLGTFNVIYYVASSSRVLFMEPDPGQVTVGLIAAQ